MLIICNSSLLRLFFAMAFAVLWHLLHAEVLLLTFASTAFCGPFGIVAILVASTIHY